MLRGTLALLVVGALFSAAVGLRPLENDSPHRRQLLDINLGRVSQSFTITAFGTGNTTSGQCYIQGYPGSRADTVVAGPLFLDVVVGTSVTVSFSRGVDTYFQNYNYSGYTNETTLNQNSSYGVISFTYTPTAAGHTVNTLSGLISGGAPITAPTCLVSVNFYSYVPTPPTPPPPSPTTPSPGTRCSGAVPCYCQNGYCFNNGATLSTNCAPPSGQTCYATSVSPSSIGIQYAYGYPSSVNVCRCTGTSG